MNPNRSSPLAGLSSGAEDDSEVVRVLDAYLSGIEAGQSADPEKLLADHPALAGQLRAYLEVMHLAGRLAEDSGAMPAGPSSDGSTPPLGSSLVRTFDLGPGPAPQIQLRELLDDREPLVKTRSPEMPDRDGAGLGRFQLQGEIARGGMGAILKGRDVDLGRDLAIKVLLDAHQGNPEVVRRFIEEAQIGGQLQHPGVVPVYELGTFPDRRPYFAMKLVKGQTLAALLQDRSARPDPPPVGVGRAKCGSPDPAHGATDGFPEDSPRPVGERVAEGRVRGSGVGCGSPDPDPGVGRGSPDPAPGATEGLPRAHVPTHDDLPRFLSIFEAVCQTVAYAHARGVIHRDLKPSNVMVGSFGEVQVMDWGLAKVLPQGGIADEEPAQPAHQTVIMTVRSGSAGSGSESQAGSVLGTPAYMAPEQARGEMERIDERADVFGLGAILCEILTGRSPYAGSSRGEIRANAARGELADARVRLDTCGAGAELIGLAKDCLAAERDRRPRHAGEVARRISTYQTGVQERLRAAELAQAQAQTRAEEEAKRRLVADNLAREAHARAEEERKRRWLTVALAASILGFVVLGGGGWTYLVRQRTTRLMATTRVVIDALAEAEHLHGQAQTAPLGDLTKWSEAIGAVKRARDLLAEGEADDALHHRVMTALAELEREQGAAQERADAVQRDRKLLAELEMIRGNRSEHWDPKRSDGEYASAFRRFGIDPDQIDPQEAGRRIALRSEPVELASFLDDWAVVRRKAGAKRDEASWRRLLAAARAADPDPWRAAVRDLIGRNDPAELRRMADDPKALESQPASSLLLLAVSLKEQDDSNRAERVLRQAWRLAPGDFWINVILGSVHWSDDRHARPEEAARYYSAAVAIRPRSSAAHNNLGNALRDQGKLEEAIAEYREALRLKPNYHEAHTNLGAALNDQGKLEEAITEYREALRLNPDFPGAHNNLGIALIDQGKLEEAIAEYHEALRLKPNYHEAHTNLGNALKHQGRLEEAITKYREALHFKPDYSAAHNGLGNALDGQGKLEEAITEYREALRLKPDLAEAHGNLGLALRARGEITEAIAELRRARDLGRTNPKFAQEVQRELTATERQASLAARLPSILAGKLKPADAAEMLGFAQLCYKKKLHGASARFWVEAFQAQPKLADDMQFQHRYNAACAAALAGCGQGKDEPPLDEAAKARWRKQAIDWLKADLAAWSKILDEGPPQARPFIDKTLQHWKADADLAGLRDPAALTKLSEDEQKACRALWAEVEAILAKAGQKTLP